jgi:hypothetical protein
VGRYCKSNARRVVNFLRQSVRAERPRPPFVPGGGEFRLPHSA